jgi:GlpG protein
MRSLGHLSNETHAQRFADYLYVKGIGSQIEAERDGTWTIWVLSDDDLPRAREMFDRYAANPSDASFVQTAQKAQSLREREAAEEKAVQARTFEGDRVFTDRRMQGTAPLTLVLMAISIGVYLVSILVPEADGRFLRFLFISERIREAGLPEVRGGQVWRLVTPIFLHFHILHILFNMLWLKDLGGMIENRYSTLYLGLFVLLVGISSNLAQFFAAGPGFGGMSGVVYGLLGYIWMKGKFDPGSGLHLPPSIVAMMLIWFLFGFTGLLNIANAAHGVGLAAGSVWGILSAQSRNRI